MDWRHNQFVGIGAAVLLVVAIVVVFKWSGSETTKLRAGRVNTYMCESTGETLQVSELDLDDPNTAEKYMPPYGTAIECDKCGQTDLYRAYYCPTCKKFYKYEVNGELANAVICPEGHDAVDDPADANDPQFTGGPVPGAPATPAAE